MSLTSAACRYPVFPYPRPGREIFGSRRWSESHRCWSWRCEGCALLTIQDVRRIIRAGLVAAGLENLPVILLTLTEPSVSRSVSKSSRSLTALMKRLQAQNGGGLRWLAVLEWQRRGAPHWHVLIAGLAYCRATRTKSGRVRAGNRRGSYPFEVRKERDLRTIVLRHGFVQVFNVHAVGTDDPVLGAGEVAGYLCKYLTKTEDMVSLPKGSQPFRSSRGRNQWARGMSLTSLRKEAAERAMLRGRP